MAKFIMPKAQFSGKYDNTLRGTGNDALRQQLKQNEYDINDKNEAMLNEAFSNTLNSNCAEKIISKNTKYKKLENIDRATKLAMLNNTIGNIFYNAIPLDESFKSQYKVQLLKEFDDRILEDTNGDINMLFNNISNKSDRLNSLVEACKKKANKLKKKKLKEEDGEELDLDDMIYMTDEDDLKIDIEDYDQEEVSNLIKDKVVKVIADETESEEKRKELVDEINSSKELNESVKIFQENKIEKNTLFKSIMTNNYVKSIKELGNNGNVSLMKKTLERLTKDNPPLSSHDLKVTKEFIKDFKEWYSGDRYYDCSTLDKYCYDQLIKKALKKDIYRIYFIDNYYVLKYVKNKSLELYYSNKEGKHLYNKSIMIDGIACKVHRDDEPKKVNESIEYDSTLYATKLNGEVNVNMDMIFAESIIRYTLLETFYTLRIKDYTCYDIEKLSESLTLNK